MIKELITKSLMTVLIILLFGTVISSTGYNEVYAKSTSNAKIKRTNKKADKAYMKIVSKIFQDTDSEWDTAKYADPEVAYLFTDLTGDGIHEAIILYRHNTDGSGGQAFDIYTYKKKKAKQILTGAGIADFTVYKDSKTLVVSEGKKGWQWYDCYFYNGKKYVSVGGCKRNNNYDASDVMSDEEYYAVLNEHCHGVKEEISSSLFKGYYEKRLRNTGYSGKDAYSVYLSLIQGEKSKIDKYNWQRGYYGYGTMTEDMISKPIAFADVYGDDTPELIYFACDDSDAYDIANMYIVTYEDGQVKKLFDGYSDGMYGKSYYLFQQKGDKTLYIREAFGDINWTERYLVLEDGKWGYSLEERYRLNGYQDCEFPYNEYYKNGAEAISENEYHSAISSMEKNVEAILMSTKLYSGFGKEFVDKYGCQAMTSNEAIGYLKSIVE